MEVLYQQLPLIVAGTCLILGALLSKRLAKTINLSKFWPYAAILLVLSFIFGGQVTMWLTAKLASFEIVSLTFSRYVSTGLLTFVSGFVFGIFANQKGKQKSNSDK